MLLGGEDDPLQFIAGDIDELTQLFQRLIQVRTTDPDPFAGQRVVGVVLVLAWRSALGVMHAGQTVVDHCHRHQNQRVEQHGLQQVVAQRRQP
ncbi:hypothetical protein D3C79_727770 [compost metagenome]